MSFDEKEHMDSRINFAVMALDADYQRAQADAAYFRELYYNNRELAEQYHEQRMILLEAKAHLWNTEEDF